MWLFHSPTHRISNLCQNSTVYNTVFKGSHVVLLVNGDYKHGSRRPGLNGIGLEKAHLKMRKSVRDEQVTFTFSPY